MWACCLWTNWEQDLYLHIPFSFHDLPSISFLPLPSLPSRFPSSLPQCTDEESVHLFPFMLQDAKSPLADVYHKVTRLMVNVGADEQNAQAKTALEDGLTEIARSVAQNCFYSTCQKRFHCMGMRHLQVRINLRLLVQAELIAYSFCKEHSTSYKMVKLWA